MAGLGRFSSEFRANSERTPSKLQANSGEILSNHPKAKASISLSLCATNLLGWLTTGNASALGVKPTMRGTQQLVSSIYCIDRCSEKLSPPQSTSVQRSWRWLWTDCA